MTCRNFLIGVGSILWGGWVAAAPLTDAALERPAYQALQQVSVAGEQRFSYMRYFKPTEQFVHLSQDKNVYYERALAMYLLNMYVSVRVYNVENPQALTLNYLGILDGFERFGAGFDFAYASRFYQQHRKAIDTLFEQYLRARTYQWPRPREQEIKRWIRLLETAPKRERQVAFTFPGKNHLNASLPSQAAAKLGPWLSLAQTQIRQQVITYDEPGLQLEDFDVHIGNHTYRRKRTYRWVKDECNYSSYLIAKQLTRALVAYPEGWEHTHVYLLTATPRQGEFLTPAQGARFKLADGTDGLHWRYHTAVLVVFQHQKKYTAVILDNFLAGATPVSLAQWLTHFHSQTVFRAQPFSRSKTIEDALKTPSRLDGKAVWADGLKYEPAAVLK